MCTEQNAHDQALHVALEHGHQAVVVPCVELLGEAIPEVESDIRKIIVGMGAALEHNVEDGEREVGLGRRSTDDLDQETFSKFSKHPEVNLSFAYWSSSSLDPTSRRGVQPTIVKTLLQILFTDSKLVASLHRAHCGHCACLHQGIS